MPTKAAVLVMLWCCRRRL